MLAAPCLHSADAPAEVPAEVPAAVRAEAPAEVPGEYSVLLTEATALTFVFVAV